MASTPPCGAVPAQLAWRRTSSERSTPGASPYQMPNTPSTLAPGNRPTCWLPHPAVGGTTLVDPGGEAVVFFPAPRVALPPRPVVGPERRAAIAGDEARG